MSFNKIEKLILLTILRRSRPTTSRIPIIGYEKIKTSFPEDEIITTWDNLKREGWVEGEVNGGGIGPMPAYKKLKKYFWLELFLYRCSSFVKRSSKSIWEHLWVKIVVGVIGFVILRFIKIKLGL